MGRGFVTTAHVDLGGVTKKVSPANVAKGRMAMASQILLDTTNYVPMRDGDLRGSGSVGKAGGTVSWNTVYARAQFYGTNGIVTFRKYTVAGTGKNWYAKAKDKHLAGWKQKAVKGMGL